jgi:hypothetical protein
VEGSMTMANYQYPSMHEFHLLEEDAQTMANRLQLDLPIILFNAIGFCGFCYSVLDQHEHYRRTILKQPDATIKDPTTLNSKQMVHALEFFLQMDGK